jgi:hypothetical protein
MGLIFMGKGLKCRKLSTTAIVPLNAYRANMNENTLLLGALN